MSNISILFIGGVGGAEVMLLFGLPIIILMIAAMWKVFAKAGQPGWAVLIPIYNAYILTQIAKKPGWWVVLLLLPYVNVVFSIIVSINIAKQFSKGSGFGVGLALLGIVFYPILGFGDAEYNSGNDEALLSDFGTEEA
jgi:hypothetical protein